MGPDMPCGILYSTVANYADRHDLDADILFSIIKSLDCTYLDWWAEDARRRG